MAVIHTESFGWSDTAADYIAYKGYSAFSLNGLGAPWRHTPGSWTGSYYADLSYAGGTPSQGALHLPSIVSGSQRFYMGFRIKNPNLGGFSFAGSNILTFDDSGTILSLRTSGSNHLNIAGTGANIVFASGSVVVTDGNWHYIEVDADCTVPNGTVNVYVDGTLDITYAGGNGLTGFTLENALMQDLYVADNTAPNNAVLGPVQVECRLPNAAGASSAWTPNGSGANYTKVADTPHPDGDTSYVSTLGVGNRDYYGLPAIAPASPTAIPAVALYLIADKDGSGARSLKPSIRSSTTDLDGATYNPANGSYGGTRLIAQVDPATSAAWTASAANAAQAGQLLSA